MKKTPKLRKFWNLIKKNDAKMDEESRMQYVQKPFFLNAFIVFQLK